MKIPCIETSSLFRQTRSLSQKVDRPQIKIFFALFRVEKVKHNFYHQILTYYFELLQVLKFFYFITDT